MARTVVRSIAWILVGAVSASLLLRFGVPAQTVLVVLCVYLAADWTVETAYRAWRTARRR